MNLSKSFKYIKISNPPEKVGKKSEIKAVYYLVSNTYIKMSIPRKRRQNRSFYKFYVQHAYLCGMIKNKVFTKNGVATKFMADMLV